MANYRLYRIDRRGQIAGVAEVLAADSDAQACLAARALQPDGALEIWQSNRLVARLPAAE